MINFDTYEYVRPESKIQDIADMVLAKEVTSLNSSVLTDSQKKYISGLVKN